MFCFSLFSFLPLTFPTNVKMESLFSDCIEIAYLHSLILLMVGSFHRIDQVFCGRLPESLWLCFKVAAILTIDLVAMYAVGQKCYFIIKLISQKSEVKSN